LRLFSFGGYGLALAALALMVFGAIECLPKYLESPKDSSKKQLKIFFKKVRFFRTPMLIQGRLKRPET